MNISIVPQRVAGENFSKLSNGVIICGDAGELARLIWFELYRRGCAAVAIG